MIRTFFWGTLIVLSISVSSQALTPAILSEPFSSPSLDSRLYTTASSSAYSIGQLTPGSTWQMTKQAGTTTGSVEIHTNFKVSGNFVAQLSVNRAALGTGEVGMRFGDFWNYPIAELFARVDGVQQSGYFNGGYVIAGHHIEDAYVTLRLSRSGNQIKSYVNNYLFGETAYWGTDFVTIFLRPNSGGASFNPSLGQADAHSVILDQFTLTADAFVPEPSTWMLLLWGLILAWMPRRGNGLKNPCPTHMD